MKLYVQNKVEAISLLFHSSFWGYTPTAKNPANHVKCGFTTKSLLNSYLLFKYCLKTNLAFLLLHHGLNGLNHPLFLLQLLLPSQTNKLCFHHRMLALSYTYFTSIIIHAFKPDQHTCITFAFAPGPPTTSEINFAETQWIRAEQ